MTPCDPPSEHGKKKEKRLWLCMPFFFSFLFSLEAWQKWRNRFRKKGESEMLVTFGKSQFGSSLTCPCNVSIGFQSESGS
jgi:hypothetical protein